MKLIALLSGGLDSTVNLACAVRKSTVALALTFDYGQKAARREIEASRFISRKYGVGHEVVRLPWLRSICKTSLVARRKPIPQVTPQGLENVGESKERARAVWVPNRNAVFINIAAAYAESLGAGKIVAGFNREEARTFPDNSSKFVRAANFLLASSTLSSVKVGSYTQDLVKEEIVALGKKIGAPLEAIWFCYLGGLSPCMKCESCVRARRAFEKVHLWDWYLKESLYPLGTGGRSTAAGRR